jgi:RNA polymerase sigma factor (TIGR02999 family)
VVASPPTDATQLLLDIATGDVGAREQMLPLIYDELRRLARHYLARERSDHTLQPTALVHEAYLRLIDQKRADWNNRAQFLGLAAAMMRRILLNHARDRVAGKRGGGAHRVTLGTDEGSFAHRDLNIIALDDALHDLAKMDERKARIVDMKFFAGLTTDEIAEALTLSTATVEREWAFARAWLYGALNDPGEGSR